MPAIEDRAGIASFAEAVGAKLPFEDPFRYPAKLNLNCKLHFANNMSPITFYFIDIKKDPLIYQNDDITSLANCLQKCMIKPCNGNHNLDWIRIENFDTLYSFMSSWGFGLDCREFLISYE